MKARRRPRRSSQLQVDRADLGVVGDASRATASCCAPRSRNWSRRARDARRTDRGLAGQPQRPSRGVARARLVQAASAAATSPSGTPTSRAAARLSSASGSAIPAASSVPQAAARRHSSTSSRSSSAPRRRAGRPARDCGGQDRRRARPRARGSTNRVPTTASRAAVHAVQAVPAHGRSRRPVRPSSRHRRSSSPSRTASAIVPARSGLARHGVHAPAGTRSSTGRSAAADRPRSAAAERTHEPRARFHQRSVRPRRHRQPSLPEHSVSGRDMARHASRSDGEIRKMTMSMSPPERRALRARPGRRPLLELDPSSASC